MTAPQSTQDRYTQAAATAAALYAAAKTPTPVDLVASSGRIIANAALITTASAAATGRMITNLWRTTDPYNEVQAQAFIAKSGQLIVAAQRSVAAATTAAHVMQQKSMGIKADIAVTIPDNVRGSSVKFTPDEVLVKRKPQATVTYQARVDVPPRRDRIPAVEPDLPKPQERVVDAADSEPDRLFERAVITFRYHESIGADPATANNAAEERIGKLIDANLMLAQRLAEQETMRQAQAQDSRIIGYRRIIRPELSQGGVCGLCVAASDRIYKVEELKLIHYRCKCAVLEVTKSHDPGFHLNEGDLARLYNDAGEKLGYPSTGGYKGKHLKRTRYDVVHHAELGPVLVRVKGEKVPYYSVLKPVSTDGTEKPGKSRKPTPESPREVAARQLPILRASLNRLRERGLAEDSAPVQYHLKQIAKFELLAKAA